MEILDTYYERKENEILSCLNGELVDTSDWEGFEEEDPLIDLWHLRYLALTRGGLLSPAIRKRVWPKLVGVNEHILVMTSDHVPPGHDLQHAIVKERNISGHELDLIKEDTNSCIWHVDYYMKRGREKKTAFKKLAIQERDDDS